MILAVPVVQGIAEDDDDDDECFYLCKDLYDAQPLIFRCATLLVNFCFQLAQLLRCNLKLV